MSNVALFAFLLGAASIAAPGAPMSGAPIAPILGTQVSGTRSLSTPPSRAVQPARQEPAAPCAVAVDSAVVPEAADEALAHTACDMARARFAELFGEPVPEVRVILWERPHYRMGLLSGEAAIFWPSSEAMTPRTKDRAAAEEHVAAQWREVLPHEISHILLAVRFFRDSGATPPGEYGTPLPDWLDEAVAIWAEPQTSRQRRVEQARELPDEYLDLHTILTTPHPATGRSAAYVARDGTARPADFTLWAFYPQAIAVLAFIHEHGGTAATSELVRRIQDEQEGPQAVAGLPGLPADFEQVDALWREWLRGE